MKVKASLARFRLIRVCLAGAAARPAVLRRGKLCRDKIPLTVPLIYHPTATTLTGSLSLPTSIFANPVYAPRPTYPGSRLEPFPAIRLAAVTFSTPKLAIDEEYAFVCGALTEWLQEEGLSAVNGPWEQAWVTYSTESESPHVNECWIEVAAGKH